MGSAAGLGDDSEGDGEGDDAEPHPVTREIIGKATGDEAMVAEGIAEQIDAEVKLRAEHEKEAHEG